MRSVCCASVKRDSNPFPLSKTILGNSVLSRVVCFWGNGRAWRCAGLAHGCLRGVAGCKHWFGFLTIFPYVFELYCADFAEKFGADCGMLYFCSNDSVANDYRFVARMRNEQSFLKLFIKIWWIKDGSPWRQGAQTDP